MKKIMAVVLSLAMMIGMAAICSFAAEDGYTVNGVVSIPENGKTTLSTSVTVPENANLAGIQFDISYNADKLTFDSVDTAVADNVIAGWTKDTADKGAGKYRIQAFTAAPTEKSILNNATAKIADVVFTVAEGAVIENDDISIKVVDAASDQGDEVITVTDRFQGNVEVLKVDTAALEKAIADAEAIKADGYTAESYKALEDALKDAKDVLDDKAATQTKINDAVQSLNDAVAALVKLATEEDKSALEEVVKETEKLNKSEYTAESYKAVQDAIDAANAIMKKDGATQSEIEAAKKAVADAVAALVKVSGDNNGGQTPGDNTNNNGSTDDGSDPTPGTSDYNMVIYVALVVLSLAAISFVVLKKRRAE